MNCTRFQLVSIYYAFSQLLVKQLKEVRSWALETIPIISPIILALYLVSHTIPVLRNYLLFCRYSLINQVLLKQIYAYSTWKVKRMKLHIHIANKSQYKLLTSLTADFPCFIRPNFLKKSLICPISISNEYERYVVTAIAAWVSGISLVFLLLLSCLPLDFEKV